MPPVWLWPNLLSLDAPLVALAWQALLAHDTGIALLPAGRAVLGLTVWTIYIADRLLDARDATLAAQTARHRFSRQHWRALLLLLVLLLAIDVALIVPRLNPLVLRGGSGLALGVALYFLLLHVWHKRIPKAVLVAGLFTAGVSVVAWSRAGDPWHAILVRSAALFVLCLGNLILIERWERQDTDPVTRVLNRFLELWIGLFLLFCLLQGNSPWFRSISLSAVGLLGLVRMETRLPREVRRALVDAVLLTPVLFL